MKYFPSLSLREEVAYGMGVLYYYFYLNRHSHFMSSQQCTHTHLQMGYFRLWARVEFGFSPSWLNCLPHVKLLTLSARQCFLDENADYLQNMYFKQKYKNGANLNSSERILFLKLFFEWCYVAITKGWITVALLRVLKSIFIYQLHFQLLYSCFNYRQ